MLMRLIRMMVVSVLVRRRLGQRLVCLVSLVSERLLD
jgi:hypothetical protein